MFKPEMIYYEEGIENYELGRELLEKYKAIPKKIIENHNNIEEIIRKEGEIFLRELMSKYFNNNEIIYFS